MLAKTCRFFAVIQYSFIVVYDSFFFVVPPLFIFKKELPYVGPQWKFLTTWTLVLQTAYFFIAFLNDLIGSNDNKLTKTPIIRRIKDYVFAGLAFPSAMYVGITFWGLWSIDRELVFPKALDEFFPSWLNHLMHTNIMVFIVLEMFLTFRKYPSRKNGLAGMVVFLLAYLIWMHVIYFYSGKWVYPILDVLNWQMKIVFYFASLGLGIVLYLVGEFLNNKIWAKQLSQVKKTGKKKAN